MQIEALKVFCDIVQLQSFSKAAAENRLTQPAASRIVHQIEERLGGVQLIDRSTRPLQLTPLGQIYYDRCKELVDGYLELEAVILRESARLTPTVQVAAIYSVGLGDMHEYVERFTTQYRPARARIEYLHPHRVYEKVRDGTADLGLVSFPGTPRDLVVLPWRRERMVLVCPPGHWLTRLPTVTVAHLSGERYVAFDRGLDIRRKVDEFLRKQDVTVDIRMEFDNVEYIKKGIEAGEGVALLPEPTLQRELQTGTLMARPLHAIAFDRPLCIIHRPHLLNPAGHHFIQILRGSSSASREPQGGSTGSQGVPVPSNQAGTSSHRSPTESEVPQSTHLEDGISRDGVVDGEDNKGFLEPTITQGPQEQLDSSSPTTTNRVIDAEEEVSPPLTNGTSRRRKAKNSRTSAPKRGDSW